MQPYCAVVVLKRKGAVVARANSGTLSGTGQLDVLLGHRQAQLLAVAADHGSFPIVLETYRECLRDGTYEFRATGTRRYWRLQNIEACDGLADYVDIYY